MKQEDIDTINDAVESLRAKLAGLQTEFIEVEAEGRDFAAKNADSQIEAAENRRSGKDGSDWQALQQRIDMNQTTFRDVIAGVDKSPEATAVRRDLGVKLADVRDTANEETDLEQLAELSRAQDQLLAQLAASKEAFRKISGY